ncbi:MAG TPA: DUF4345 domain-containing protein [Allosphingosinicella sp.]|nr:DUF4345 domain-containing protein [Allosphingosinicella sp.]
MRLETERRLLQVAVAAACLVPVSAGAAGILEGAGMVKGLAGQPPTDLDSHFRYLSGLLLGMGLAFSACIPGIERKRLLFRALSLIVVVGGLARLFSALEDGLPGSGHHFGLVMELLVVPLLMLWQGRIARIFERRGPTS